MAGPNQQSTPNVVPLYGSIDSFGNMTGLLSPNGQNYTPSGGSAAAVAVNASRNLTSADEGQTLDCSTSLTLTVPAGLALKSVTVVPPDVGNVSIASGGIVLLNGATTTVARGAALNSVIAIIGRSTVDTYKVTGA